MNEFSSISFVLLLTYVFAAQQPPLPKSSPQHNEPVPKEVVESRDNSFEYSFQEKHNILLTRLTEITSKLEAENGELKTKLEECKLAIQENNQIISDLKAENHFMSEKLAKKTKKLKDIQDQLNQKEKLVSSEMGTNASNLSNSSRQSIEEVPPHTSYYSHLQSFEAINQEAVKITRAFLASLLPHLPKRCEEWFKGSSEQVQQQMETVAGKIVVAKRHLQWGSAVSQKMDKIITFLLDIHRDVKEMNCDSTSPDFAKHSSKCVGLINDTFTSFQTINFIEIPFLPFIEFTKFLTSFVDILNSNAKVELTNIYEIRMRELIFRSITAYVSS